METPNKPVQVAFAERGEGAQWSFARIADLVWIADEENIALVQVPGRWNRQRGCVAAQEIHETAKGVLSDLLAVQVDEELEDPGATISHGTASQSPMPPTTRRTASRSPTHRVGRSTLGNLSAA